MAAGLLGSKRLVGAWWEELGCLVGTLHWGGGAITGTVVSWWTAAGLLGSALDIRVVLLGGGMAAGEALAPKEAGAITGVCLSADGGWTAR